MMVNDDGREILLLISELCRTARCCRQDSAFCADVTFNQFLVIDAVYQQGSLKMSDIHRELAVDKSTTSRVVHPLVRKKLVKREKSSHDGRSINLSLTEKGKETHKRIWQCISDMLQAIKEEIPEEKRSHTYQAVGLFSAAVRKASQTQKLTAE